MPKKLSDIEVHTRLYAARLALGEEEGETVAGNRMLEMMRGALTMANAVLIRLISRRET